MANATPKAKPNDGKKTERLRQLRLADEAARRQAGTWGDVTVGEIAHADSESVYVQVWKGARRPNPLGSTAPPTGVPADDWTAIVAWLNAENSTGFVQRVVASHLSAAEAQKVKDLRLAEHRAAGRILINRTGQSGSATDSTQEKS